MRAIPQTAMILHPLRAQILEEEILRQRAEEAARRDQEWVATQNPSPFGEFLQALHRKFGHESVTNAGHCHWTSFPLHETIAHGLWVVMLRTADKLQLPLDTKDDVVRTMAPRIDRMINLGIILEYGGAEAAAKAFENKVVAEIAQAAKSLPQGQSAMLQDIVQLPAARFFAELIRFTTAYREQLLEVRATLASRDRHRCGLKILSRDTIATATRHLTLQDDSDWEPDWESVAAELEALNGNIRLQGVLAKMPVKQTEYQLQLQAERAQENPPSIETDWLNTELLLAAANLPNRGFIDVIEEYSKCVKALRRMTDETLSKRFFKRLGANRVSLTAHETDTLKNLVTERIRHLRVHSERFSLESAPNIIFCLDLRSPALDETTALDLALYHAGNRGEEHKALDEVVGRHLAAKIPWAELTAHKIKYIAQNKVVPPEEIAKGIGMMRQDQRRKATKYLLETFEKRLDPKTLDVLTRTGLMKITLIFLSNNMARLPKRVLEDNLPRTIRLSNDRKDPIHQRMDVTRLFMRMIAQLDSEAVRQILDDPTLRDPMVSMVENDFWLNGTFGSKHNPKLVRRFLKKVGEDLWRHYVMACELTLRESAYGESPEVILKEKIFLPPWEELEDDDIHWFRPSEAMGLSKAHARVLLKTTFTEDKIFLWLHEAHDTPRKLLAEYHKKRELYFKFTASVPKSQRTD